MSKNVTMEPGTGWQEVFFGASKDAEDRLIKENFVPAINEIQRQIKANTTQPNIRRAQHVKMLAGTKNAEFRIAPNIPEDLRVAFFQPGKLYRAHVRFSNASGIEQEDLAPDLRGAALRVKIDQGRDHDFLLTNAPSNHVCDAKEFMTVAKAFSRPGKLAEIIHEIAKSNKEDLLAKLASLTDIAEAFESIVKDLGLRKAFRIFAILNKQTSIPVESLATEQYWSRAPIAFGRVALQYKLSQGSKRVRAGRQICGKNLRRASRTAPSNLILKCRDMWTKRRPP